jgi:hypothetical protein
VALFTHVWHYQVGLSFFPSAKLVRLPKVVIKHSGDLSLLAMLKNGKRRLSKQQMFIFIWLMSEHVLFIIWPYGFSSLSVFISWRLAL